MNEHLIPPKPRVLVETEPFIPYVKEEDFASNLQPVIEPYKKRMGFLPNALKLYAYRPEIAETLWQLNSKVMRDPSSTLDQFLKRKLAAVACATNGRSFHFNARALAFQDVEHLDRLRDDFRADTVTGEYC